jgi:hypothetical protein
MQAKSNSTLGEASALRVFIGPTIAGEIYDAMEGAIYDLDNRPESDLGPFPGAVRSLREKLGTVKPRHAIDLTHDEVGRLAHELEFASERVREWDSGLASRMQSLLRRLSP